ncbi:tyrosine-protein kinase [Dyadobacter sp. CY326]|uniref:GumC family protein n=1 Tax=Dyadobacter sp. CY326 TaxID=2907300 RepID=UPI001F2CD88F|nr:tyrosine-protein kinase [Dyadobacter sp. CY326]MCE7066125.1 polysaccharide biosynthesis tyrosine autokinase [Dyadobacter sp. CY326]
MEDRIGNRFYGNPPAHKKFNLKSYLSQYAKYWYLFAVSFPLCFAAAYYYLQTTQPVYLSSTTLLIKEQESEMGSGKAIMDEMVQFDGNKSLENEMGILRSKLLMGLVAKELGLDIAYNTKDGMRTIDLYGQSPIKVNAEIVSPYALANPMIIHLVENNKFTINDMPRTYRLGDKLRTPWGLISITKGSASPYRDIQVNFADLAGMTRNMLGSLNVKVLYPESTLLELTFEDVSVHRGKDVLNKLLDVYVQTSLHDKNSEASNTLKFIESRLGLITGELQNVEKDVEVYKKSRGLTDISAESQLFLTNITENDVKLNEINTKINILESVDRFIRNPEASKRPPATYMIDDPILVSLLTKYNELNLQRERYALTTEADNPLVETISTQMNETRQGILENVQNLRRGMDVTKSNLEGINTRFSSGLRSIPRKEREYVGIKRQQTIKENLYLYLLQKREETALAYASTVTDSRLIDTPMSSSVPIKPKRSTIWIGSGLASIIFPLILINLLLMLDTKVNDRQEIEEITQTAILGEIGIMKKKRGQKVSESVFKIGSRSKVSEQVRALRTNLQYLGDGKCRVIMITSTISNEGKSFISSNLAASLAYSDKRVILLGLDLRKPSLHEYLEISNKTGVTNYLINKMEIDELVQNTGIHPKFDVIPSGPQPPNPSELLTNGRLNTLIAELRTRYDYVLIDSPPYALVTDSALISEHTDANLYVIRYNYTLLEHLRSVRELKLTKRIANLSIVYNGVNGGSDYGYGYGYFSEANALPSIETTTASQEEPLGTAS